MKRLIFMRHGYLEGKYKDYSKLNFEDFKALLLKKIAPSIDVETTKKELLSKQFLSEIEFVLCSAENRGIETAQLVRKITTINFEVSSLLNEVSFTNGIINPEDIINFDYLRKKILTQFYNSNCSERFEDAKMRFIQFLEYARHLDHETILCITHGWFMRLIEIYSLKSSLEKVSLNELLEAKVPSFLDFIEIIID